MKYAVFCLLYSTLFAEANTISKSLVGFDCNDTENGFACTKTTEDSDDKLLLVAEDKDDDEEDDDEDDDAGDDTDDDEEDDDSDDDTDNDDTGDDTDDDNKDDN